MPAVNPRPLAQDPLSSSSYSSSKDTIYVSGGGNNLENISIDIGNESLFSYDKVNSTAYCHVNMTIEGWLDISFETLFISREKKIRINSTGTLNITNSRIEALDENNYWWEGEDRYSLILELSGTVFIENSKIFDTGWSKNTEERGMEIIGNDFTLLNTTISKGYGGLVFVGAGDITGKIENITIKNMDANGINVPSGSKHVKIENSTLLDNWEEDILMGGSGNITLSNCTLEDYSITNSGRLNFGYIQNMEFFNISGPLTYEPVNITRVGGGWKSEMLTDAEGNIKDLPLLWVVENQSEKLRYRYSIECQGKKIYFSPSNYNRLSMNTSRSQRLAIYNISAAPTSFVPVNNDWKPHNITLRAIIKNNMTSSYNGNVTFYFDDIEIGNTNLNVPPNTEMEITLIWIPNLEGYSKIRAELDPEDTITNDNQKAWSKIFFAGYYNETITPYQNKMYKALQMMEWGVEKEDADGYYTIYQDWLPDILMEMGLAYYGAYDYTNNNSYFTRGEKQFDYALGFRDQWGLYNRSTVNEVLGRYPDTYHEWSTHRNVRAGIALQQAYLFTNNETYLNASDNIIDFILNKVAMVNVTYHNGVNYTVPWESTDPNGGLGCVKGTSKDFSFLFVNGYIQLAKLLTMAYYDENLNSSYYKDDSLLPYMNTCIKYILNDQIDSGGSKGTWAYFSYYDENHSGDPWRRRSMKYAALTAKELSRVNAYLYWDNISRALSNYSDYVEGHLTLRTSIDTQNGGNGVITTYNSWRSFYNTTGRNVSKIENILFSNIFFNDNGTHNWFSIDTDRMIEQPDILGFLYVHYNPLRTLLWDKYHNNLTKRTVKSNLIANGSAGGWNFISSNLVPNNTDLDSILNHPTNGIWGSYDKVLFFSAEKDEWRSYVPTRSTKYNSLDIWNHKMGLWIHMTKNDTLTIQGTHPYRTTIEVQPGWNMVGYPSDTNRYASDTLPTEVTKIAIFNGSSSYNLEYVYNLGSEMFVSGKGYWVYNDADYTVRWTVDY
ncbi:MAG: hypothetical protein R6U61_09165 [Thermoplasmata archaeon]